jgi:O-antigen/teichoic acid export membrane protein
MGLAFIPLYIRYLGIEAYGLIGVFAILQAWLGLLDLGMRPALAREMARFHGGAHTPQSIRELLRSVEVVAFASAGVIALGIWAGSDWLASDWLRAEKLPHAVVAQALSLMGVVAALGFAENVYISSLVGLQRQVVQNVVSTAMSTARGLGAVFVLVWVSPTPKAFFLWQAAIAVTSLCLSALVVYRSVPAAPRSARFSRTALLGIWRFAGGMLGITLLSILLTQVDKLLLSRLLSLEHFGYYALAGVVTSALFMLVGPIDSAFYPRFTELVTRKDEQGLTAAYHLGAQLVTVLMGSAAVVLVVFGERILRLWTGDAVLAGRVGPLVAVLALGAFLNGLMHMPYQLQLAHGWTGLTVKVNIVAVAILVPAILWIVPRQGALGAAWLWVTLNAGYLVFDIFFMHRRLLPTEKWRWYVLDVAQPIAATATAAGTCWLLMPSSLGRLGEVAVLLGASVCVLCAAALTAHRVRERVMRLVSALAG